MTEIAYRIRTHLLRWRHLAAMRRLEAQASLTSVPSWTRPAPHEHVYYGGPWIENYFFTYWGGSAPFREQVAASGFQYLPIFWTDLRHTHPGPEIEARLRTVIDEVIRSDNRYFTLIQHSGGIPIPLPDNVTVFSAGGVGRIPIPLLKYPERRQVHPKRHPLSFQGESTGFADPNGVRSRMVDIAEQIPGFVHPPPGAYSAYRKLIAQSRFTLCPRGFGPTSFRLYEAIALGSIPIYIWDDLSWLPYQDQLDWTRLALILHASELESLPGRIQSITDEQQQDMLDYAACHFDDYFSYRGVSQRIATYLTAQG